jgi:hypothetical protein
VTIFRLPRRAFLRLFLFALYAEQEQRNEIFYFMSNLVFS